MRKIRAWMERISLRNRLAIMTFLVALLSVTLVTSALGVYTSRVLSAEATSARAQLAKFTASSISERLQEALRVANLTLGQKQVSEAIDRVAYAEEYPLADQIHDARDIVDFTNRLETTSDFVRVRVLLCGEAIYANEQITFFRLSDEERAHMSELRARGRYYEITEGLFPYIFQMERRVVTVTYSKESRTDYNTAVGGIAVDIDTGDILRRMRNMLVSGDDAVTLYNRDGAPVLSVGDEELAALPAVNGEMNLWSRPTGAGALVYETLLDGVGWTLSYRVKAETLFSQVTALMRNMLITLVLVLVLAFCMTIQASSANSKRLLKLSAAMDRVRSGDMDVRVEEGGENEVGVMEHSFNYLLDELRHMLEAKLEDAKQMQSLETRLLQSQIKPHFLYNTLDLICWRLNKAGDERGARYVQALAQFYRIGLSRGSEMIPLSEELRHVQLYVEIQNFRLDGSIELQITLPQDCKDIPVPGNILQPLVENSIGAGIREKQDGRGRVRIVCASDASDLRILISDDGVGTDIEAVEKLLMQRSDSHYGVWNVNKRLRLLFGEEAGLTYSRNAEGGVDVLVFIPAPRAASGGATS